MSCRLLRSHLVHNDRGNQTEGNGVSDRETVRRHIDAFPHHDRVRIAGFRGRVPLAAFQFRGQGDRADGSPKPDAESGVGENAPE